METLAYRALIQALHVEATLKAAKVSRSTSQAEVKLSLAERFALCSELLSRLNSNNVKFDVLERKHIRNNLNGAKINDNSYMSKRIGRKLCLVWTEADIRAILNR